MTTIDENELAKRASKKHHEHMAKAKHHLGKAMECHKNAMECVAKLAKMHHEHHEAHKAAGSHEFDHGAAAKLIARLHGHHSDTHDHHEMAHHHLSLAHEAHEAGGHAKGGRVEQGGGTNVTDHHEGTKTPEGELLALLQHHMTEGHVPDLNDGSGPSKAAGSNLMEQLIKATAEAAYQKGRAEALEKMPATTNANPRTFDFGKVHGFNTAAEGGNDPRREDMAKVIGHIDMNDPDARQAAAARMLGNMVGKPSLYAQSTDDAAFRGQAGTRG